MGYSVPTKNSLMDAGKTGFVDGTTLATGETLGRSVLGPGLGTAIGGMVAASAQSGTARDRMATIAAERGMSELFTGASGGGGNNQRGRI